MPVLVMVRDIHRISVFGTWPSLTASDNSANFSLAEVLRLLPLPASPPAETAETLPIAVAGAGAVVVGGQRFFTNQKSVQRQFSASPQNRQFSRLT